MRIRPRCKAGPEPGQANGRTRGYTFIEAIMATGILGFAATSLFVGFNSGFCLIQSTRENLRATQIMVQKMEAIRLFTWSQVNNPNNYLKSTFTEAYDPQGVNQNCGGPQYTGTVTLSVPAVGELPEAYRMNMRTITVNVSWTSSNGGKAVVHHREMQTRVARNGMQNYIWGAL